MLAQNRRGRGLSFCSTATHSRQALNCNLAWAHSFDLLFLSVSQLVWDSVHICLANQCIISTTFCPPHPSRDTSQTHHVCTIEPGEAHVLCGTGHGRLPSTASAGVMRGKAAILSCFCFLAVMNAQGEAKVSNESPSDLYILDTSSLAYCCHHPLPTLQHDTHLSWSPRTQVA